MNFFEQIGNNILQILKEKNINQTELAEKKEVDEKPVLMFMGEIKKNTKKDMEFLTKVISEIISIEEALNE